MGRLICPFEDILQKFCLFEFNLSKIAGGIMKF